MGGSGSKYFADWLGSTSHLVAKALFKQNRNLEEALTFARRAVEIFTFLRMPDDLAEAQETNVEIEKAICGE